MSKSTLGALLPAVFIVLGAILWKFVLKRDFTWQAISSPPKMLFIITLLIAVVVFITVALIKRH